MLLNTSCFICDLFVKFVKTMHETFLLETLTDPCEIWFHVTGIHHSCTLSTYHFLPCSAPGNLTLISFQTDAIFLFGATSNLRSTATTWKLWYYSLPLFMFDIKMYFWTLNNSLFKLIMNTDIHFFPLFDWAEFPLIHVLTETHNIIHNE